MALPLGASFAAAVLGVMIHVPVALAGETVEFPSDSLAQTALFECHQVDLVEEGLRKRTLDLALEHSERALEETPDDPSAHLSMFCALAKRVREAGLSLRIFSDLRRMRREIDQALSIAPTYGDALAAKGAFLYYLPRFFGGNAAEGLRLLEKARDLEPKNAAIRLVFADILVQKGDIPSSARESQKAEEILREEARASSRAAAYSVLTQMCADKSWPKPFQAAAYADC